MLTTPEIVAAGPALKHWTVPSVLNVRRAFFGVPTEIDKLSKGWRPRGGESLHQMHQQRQEVLSILAQWQRGSEMVAGEQLKPLRQMRIGPRVRRVWVLRGGPHQPGVRVLGVMPGRNIFVALLVIPRERVPRDANGDDDWDPLIKFVMEKAERLFHGADLIEWPVGAPFGNEHLGNVCDDF